jgi:hypothetical protein
MLHKAFPSEEGGDEEIVDAVTKNAAGAAHVTLRRRKKANRR